MASTFKSLAQYADFSGAPTPQPQVAQRSGTAAPEPPEELPTSKAKPALITETGLGFVYRIEIHLPDTQNVETFRAIFKALREELL